jgi:hypothetical protein
MSILKSGSRKLLSEFLSQTSLARFLETSLILIYGIVAYLEFEYSC